jgi:hypothetical protein
MLPILTTNIIDEKNTALLRFSAIITKEELYSTLHQGTRQQIEETKPS